MPNDLEEVYSDGHPVTGSLIHLGLFNRFHKTNASKPKKNSSAHHKCAQLNGILKTQLEEQLNFSVNKDTRFISQMKPINHLFLFCCIMNIPIKKINDKTVNNLEATPSFTVVFDIKGHAVVDLLKKF